ncbi:MAG: cell division protein ZapA [Bacteroidia bacterium]|nr:cell division protein ZapA [Bacteroidia bacterium]
MDSARDEISIKVTIGDRQYPLKIDPAEEEFVRKAAKLINEKAKFYQENFSVKDKQDSLALAALEFASDVLSITNSQETEKHLFDKKISYFQQLVDRAVH